MAWWRWYLRVPRCRVFLFFHRRFALVRLPARSRHLRCPIPLRTDGLASSLKRRRSSLRDLRCPLMGLACSRVPGCFLACACRSYPRLPGIRGVECARRVNGTHARRGTWQRLDLRVLFAFVSPSFRSVSLSFWNARVTCFCETRASFVFVCSLSASLE